MRKCKFTLISLYILCLVFPFSSSQALPRIVTGASDNDTADSKRSGILFLPILYYTPETKIAGGAAVNYYFRESGSKKDSRPSTVMPIFIYTQKKQIISELSGDLYWKDEAYHLNGAIGYIKFPNKFYGIGNNTSEDEEEEYTPRNIYLSLNFQKKVQRGLYFGARYEYTNSKIKETDEGGLLATRKILGSEGGTVSGAGILLIWDTRDNVFGPSYGGYYHLSANLFRDVLGSDYDFEEVNLDVRRYIPIFSSHVLAFQSYLNFMAGDPPFNTLSLLGGDSLMRGYYEGRYRDKNMVVFQTEYRTPIWWRLGFVAFLGFGDVADKMSHFALKDFKHSFGLGIRYSINPEEKLNIRFDLAFGKDTSGFYITFLEAF